MNYADLMHQINSSHAAYAGSTTDEGKQAAVAAREDAIRRYRAANSGGGGGGGAPAPRPASPPPPPPKGQDAINAAVKVSDDFNVFSTIWTSGQADLEKLYFQDIGGTEILSVARHDNINGEEVVYSNIANVKEVQRNFNSLNLMLSNDIKNIFNKFAIDIGRRVTNWEPTTAEMGTSGVQVLSDRVVLYLDDVKPDEYVEFQISNEFGEYEQV